MDRLSISWAPLAFDASQVAWDTVQDVGWGRDGWSRRLGAVRNVRGASVFVGVSQRDRLPPVAKLELNPSRCGDPDGWGVAPLAAVRPALHQALMAVGDLVARPADVEGARVRRLDVTRDFGGVESVPDFLRAQASLKRPWARLHLVHSDPSRNGAQTLMVGSRSGGVMRAYDKHAENPDAPDGTVRVEVEARGPWAQSCADIRLLGQLDEDSLYRLAENRWRWSQMGTEVAGLNVVVQAVTSAPGLSNTQKNGLLGFLVAQAAGAGVFCSERQARTYRTWQRELGIVGESLDVTARSFTRLDWETGRAVSRVA